MQNHIKEFQNAISDAHKKLKVSITNAAELLSNNNKVLRFKTNEVNENWQPDLLFYKGIWTQYLDTNIKCMLIDEEVHCTNDKNIGCVKCTRVLTEGSGTVPAHAHDQTEVIYLMIGEIQDTINHRVYKAGDKIVCDPNTIHEFVLKDATCLVCWFPPLEGLVRDND